ncbi:MAG: hypothetical protein KAR40_00205 [Candidatus Sabulitectum sp.]|nr:hypothetical protein [Candidatus Sabulitectum sp.]
MLNIFPYSLDGRLTQNLGTNELQYGENTLQFTIDPLPHGIYLLRASSDDPVAGKLLTIIGGAQ